MSKSAVSHFFVGLVAAQDIFLQQMSNGTAAQRIDKDCCAKSPDDPATCSTLVNYQYEYSEDSQGKTRMVCPNNPDGTCSFDNCVGGTGVDCDGVPYSLDFGVMGSIDANIVKPKDNGDGTVTIKTTVGSILHDLCCMEYPWGAFCDSSNYPISQTINALGNADNECACLLPWRKAAWNLINDRYWDVTYSKAVASSDLTFSSKQRRSWLPTSSTGAYLGPSTWGLKERAATASICAPGGTHLDCPTDDDNCYFSCFGVECSSCAPGNSDCSSKQIARWNHDGVDSAHGGDFEFCCSGAFKQIHWNLRTQYGVCA